MSDTDAENGADPDPWFRPVWADDDTPDAGDIPPPPPRRPWQPPAARPAGDADRLLAPLAAAADALARLDARAAAAPAALRAGLIARLAFREAAGWLAARHAWVHPLDLALRADNLTGRFDTAGQIGRAHQALPNTLAAETAAGWAQAADWAALADGEQAVTRALALARLLTALPRRHDPLADPVTAATLLRPLGTGDLDPTAFAAWRATAATGPARSPPSGRDDAGRDAALPPLLQAAQAAEAWMTAGIVEQPDPLPALAVAAVGLARTGALRVIPLPLWAAWPVLGQGEASALPRLRGADATWPVCFLTLAAEAARAGARALDRLQAAAAAGARLPDALDAVLAAPVLTPKTLAWQLALSPQAATRLLATLAEAGVVREVTGRSSYRAFAV
jgi:hypothetical protein